MEYDDFEWLLYSKDNAQRAAKRLLRDIENPLEFFENLIWRQS